MQEGDWSTVHVYPCHLRRCQAAIAGIMPSYMFCHKLNFYHCKSQLRPATICSLHRLYWWGCVNPEPFKETLAWSQWEDGYKYRMNSVGARVTEPGILYSPILPCWPLVLPAVLIRAAHSCSDLLISVWALTSRRSYHSAIPFSTSKAAINS